MKIAIGAEPDLLWALSSLLAEMGCEITAPSPPPILHYWKNALRGGADRDLEDLEMRAKGCDLLITTRTGARPPSASASAVRAGLPCFDRLGANHKLSVGYAARVT